MYRKNLKTNGLVVYEVDYRFLTELKSDFVVLFVIFLNKALLFGIFVKLMIQGSFYGRGKIP